MRRLPLALLAFAALACDDATAPAAPTEGPSLRTVTSVSIQDLGLPPGATESYAYGINTNGDVAGYYVDGAGAPWAFRWSAAGGFVALLRNANWSGSYGLAINNSGHVAGAIVLPGGLRAGFWRTATAFANLGTLTGDAAGESVALGLNNKGLVVGMSTNGAGLPRPVVWDVPNGYALSDFGTLPGGTWGYAQGVNDNGRVIGFGGSAAGDRAFARAPWDSQVVSLGTLPGGGASNAIGLSMTGLVVGLAEDATGATHAMVHTDGVMHDLGTLGGAQSVAFGVSDKGEIVGYSQTAAGDYHAFVWTQTSGMVDLGTLPGHVASYAQGVNGKGQVTGFSVGPDGRARAVRWQVGLQ